jgi:hypothetical protein
MIYAVCLFRLARDTALRQPEIKYFAKIIRNDYNVIAFGKLITNYGARPESSGAFF